MRLKVPKTERRKTNDTRGRRILRRTVLILVATVLLTLAGFRLVALITGDRAWTGPENAVAGAMTPIQSGFSSVVDGLVGYLYTLKYRSTLELEYNRVKMENEQLTYQAMFANQLQRELDIKNRLLEEITENQSMNPLMATVIGRNDGNYFSVLTLNKGSNDGIADQMAVTMDGALVGYTYNVSPTKCDVRTIIDSEASINGQISNTGYSGTVRGTLGVNGEALCRLYYLAEGVLPRPGDLVVTSGIGVPFPKGIPIGSVRESTRGMESNKQYIVVEPLADFQRIEYVIVLRYRPFAEDMPQAEGGSQALVYTPLETAAPVPTIQIGNDFYQLAPTPEPSVDPGATETAAAETDRATVTPSPQTPSPGGNYEYQVPQSMQTDQSYGYTLAPTATPSPTPVPPDLSVEED